MYARWVRRRGAGCHCECPDIILWQTVRVSPAVIAIHIVDLVFEDRDRALLAGHEVKVWRYDVSPAAVGSGERRGVMLSTRTTDVEPLINYVHRLGESDIDAGVTRSICAVLTRIGA